MDVQDITVQQKAMKDFCHWGDALRMRDLVCNLEVVENEILKRGKVFKLVLETEEDARFFASPTFDHLTPAVNGISLRNVELTSRLCIQLLSKCSSLSSLDIGSCTGLFITGQFLEKVADRNLLSEVLVNLSDLDVSGNQHLTDKVFNNITEAFPSLKRISLAGCQILFYKGEKPPYIQNTTALTFTNIIEFLERKGTEITGLDLCQAGLADEALRTMAKVENLELLELDLANNPEITSNGVDSLCQSQTKLQRLSLHGCVEIDDEGVKAMQQCLSDGLEHLCLAACRNISDHSVAALAKMERLKSLIMSSCSFLTNEGLVAAIQQPGWASLTELNLSNCRIVNDSVVTALCHTVPNLTSLNLSSCLGISDTGVGLMSMHFSQLQHLNLAWCQKVGDEGLMGILPESVFRLDYFDHDGLCKCLRKEQVSKILNLRKKSVPEDLDHTACESGKRVTPRDLAALSNLSQLMSLDLTACVRVTDRSLMTVVKFQELRSLRLDMNQMITDEGIAAVSRNNPRLQEMSLNHCSRISDKAVDSIVCYLPAINSLNLCNNSQLTDQALSSLVEHCTNLRTIDVSLCRHVSVTAVDKLEKSFKNSVSVQKRLAGDEEVV